MLEYRARNGVSPEYLEQMTGKLLTDKERVIRLEGRTRVWKPDGSLLCVYLPGALKEVFPGAFPTLQKIRGTTNNRGYASASQRVLGEDLGRANKRGKRTYSKEVASNILGAFDAYGANQYCRLTAYNAKQLDEFQLLVPLFQEMSRLFAENVSDRFAAQAEYCQRTEPDWVIPDTVFTTITVNSSYPTGVHKDKGDLDEGFSCLAVTRQGAFRGGVLTFPEWGVGADMQDGDLLLMDAHDWHGNTNIYCSYCDVPLDNPKHRCFAMGDEPSPERISVVAYFRTGMTECGDQAEEYAKQMSVDEKKLDRALT